MRVLLFLSIVAFSLAPPASADELCYHSDEGATCVVASDYGQGTGPCDGYAHNGGQVGVSQWSSSGSTFLGVMNQCYSGTDPQGNAYSGTTIGVYYFQSGPNGWTNEGLHLNTGEHSTYGPYCFLGEPDPVSPMGVNCPTIVRVPMILDMLP